MTAQYLAYQDLSGNYDPIHLDACRLAKTRWQWLKMVLARRGLPAGAKVVAAALQSFINERTGKAWPSHEALAEAVGLSDRAVRTALKALAHAGLIVIEERRGGSRREEGGRLRGRTCEYRLAAGGSASAEPRFSAAYPEDSCLPTRKQPSDEHTREPSREDLTSVSKREPHPETTESGGTVETRADGEERGATRETIQLPPILPHAFDDRAAYARIGQAAIKHLGFGIEHRIDGESPDTAILDRLPPDKLAEMMALCRRGKLARAMVIAEVMKLDLPRPEDCVHAQGLTT